MLISAALCQGPHIKVAAVASYWQHVENLIGSGFKLHTSRTRSRRLSGRLIGLINRLIYVIIN